jgi:hypothetical protein
LERGGARRFCFLELFFTGAFFSRPPQQGLAANSWHADPQRLLYSVNNQPIYLAGLAHWAETKKSVKEKFRVRIESAAKPRTKHSSATNNGRSYETIEHRVK